MTNGSPDYTLDTTLLRHLDKVIDWTEALGGDRLHSLPESHKKYPAPIMLNI